MKVVLATQAFSGLGGSETYAITVADHLQRLGHDVWLNMLELGPAGELASRLGVRVAVEPQELPADPDVLIVQDGVVACELAARYPLTPQVFVAHSDIFDLQLPPQLPDLVAVVVVLYDRVERRIRALALPYDIVRLTQPVDVERFKPIRPLPSRARVALLLSNYVYGARLALLRGACERAGLELRHVGVLAPEGAKPAELVLNEADVVFGKARVICEAMACGRAAYVFDHNGAEGWVTRENYECLAADNFGGQSRPRPLDEEELAADLARYEPGMGVINRDLAVAHHSATKHVAALCTVLARVSPRRTPVDAPLQELARLVRLHFRADAHAFALHAEAERLARRVEELELEVRRLKPERKRLRRRVRELELSQITKSRRWRATQAALRPADVLLAQLRRAKTRPPAPFVVGVARSGTTLLRLQLDAHPELAIPPETGWGFVAGELARPKCGPKGLIRALRELETWPDLGFDEARVLAVLRDVEPWSGAAGLRALWQAYAARHGKPRWGDKTPLHLRCMPDLSALIPEAHFIHVIRDGRDVAASVKALPFAPGDGSIEAIAEDWQRAIRVARGVAEKLQHYQEVRYERLVNEPEAVLRELCDWLDLRFDSAMLRAHERARSRFKELAAERLVGGIVITREERLRNHTHALQPPNPDRIGRWRRALTADEVLRFEATAGSFLAELGYPLAGTAADGG
jgi:hypothetical protein